MHAKGSQCVAHNSPAYMNCYRSLLFYYYFSKQPEKQFEEPALSNNTACWLLSLQLLV